MPDVDIDVLDPAEARGDGVRASLVVEGQLKPHNTGMHYQRIPTDPRTGLAAFEYKIAEELGYQKIDIIPNYAYEGVRDRDHLKRLAAADIDWALLTKKRVVGRLQHVGKYHKLLAAYQPTNVEELACLIAMIRPAKKHLIGEQWEDVRAEVWEPDPEGRYQFKKSHAVAFALAIKVQVALLMETGKA